MPLTKEDLNQIKVIVNDVVNNVVNDAVNNAVAPLATKEELKKFATKDDLEKFATKDDLDRMELRLITSIGLLERDSFARLDEHEVRIARLEAAHSHA
jgi:hypothetical protein